MVGARGVDPAEPTSSVGDPGSVYHGKHMRNGWKNAGLPWGYDFHPDLMWVTPAE